MARALSSAQFLALWWTDILGDHMPDDYQHLARQNDALTLALLQWLRDQPRNYEEVLEVWHSTCPRHTIWEDALLAGFIDHDGRKNSVVRLTSAGIIFINGHSRSDARPAGFDSAA